MTQLEYRTTLRRPSAGRLSGRGHFIVTGYNNLRTFESGTITVTRAAADTMDLSVTTPSGSSASVNGIAQGATDNAAAQALIDAMRLNTAMMALFSSLTIAANVITYTARETGTYTIVGTTPGAGDIVEAVTTAAVLPQNLRAGIMVARRVGATVPDGSIQRLVDVNSVLAGVTVLQDNIDNQGIASSGFVPPQAVGAADVYPPMQAVALVRRGPIWVALETALAVGDPIHTRHTANGAANIIGIFRNAADGGNTVQVLNAAVLRGGAAGDVAEVDFNMV